MADFSGFSHGMGIGGWLTNYKRFNVLPDEWKTRLSPGDFEHFATYITRRDIDYIASLGMDHIRLGFDQVVLEAGPGEYRGEIWEHIDRFCDWCRAAGVNIVLNLHKAVGNYCDIPSAVTLMESPELQERFIAVWVAFEKRYSGRPEIVFELLNEVNETRESDIENWNRLAARTIRAIRELNPSRRIVIGGTCANSCDRLRFLPEFDDNVIYTWHFYFPHEFTQQQGVLQPAPLCYNRRMPYPGDIEIYRDFRRFVYRDENPYPDDGRMDSNVLRRAMAPAFEYQAAHPGRTVWCGEFGTIRHCPLEWRENYMRDVISLLLEHRTPYCVWNYLSTPNDGNRFSLVDDDRREILSPRLAAVIRGEITA